jgi:hypothetical protein
MMGEDNYKSVHSADLEGGDDGGDPPAADDGEAECAVEEQDSESEDKTFI